MIADGCTFAGTTIRLDGQRFHRCRFDRCQLVYSGGELPSLDGCEFQDCRWMLDGAAARTMSLMQAMIEHGGPMAELVQNSLGLAGGSPIKALRRAKGLH